MGNKNSSKKFASFEIKNPVPLDQDRGLYDELASINERFQQVLTQFSNYQGSGPLIRDAIGKPSPETEAAAWGSVRTGVIQLRDFFEVSNQIERALPRLYNGILDNIPNNAPLEAYDTALVKHAAIVKLVCLIQEFAMRFDDLKMVNPAVQNDLAYYRRVLSRLKRERKVAEGEIRDEVVDRMSLFYANGAPMTRVLIDVTTAVIASSGSAASGSAPSGSGSAAAPGTVAPVGKMLARLAEACRGMMESHVLDSESPELRSLCLRAMTASTLMLDHIVDTGVFTKKSPVSIVAIVKLLQSFNAAAPAGGAASSSSSTAQTTDHMINALKFTTLHARDPNVLPHIKKTLW